MKTTFSFWIETNLSSVVLWFSIPYMLYYFPSTTLLVARKLTAYTHQLERIWLKTTNLRRKIEKRSSLIQRKHGAVDLLKFLDETLVA